MYSRHYDDERAKYGGDELTTSDGGCGSEDAMPPTYSSMRDAMGTGPQKAQQRPVNLGAGVT